MVLLAVFVGLRVVGIQDSFWFFGDLGRDLFVLQDWAGNLARPPLLGPQTSVISFNQTAWYYYYLFPFFLLLKHSVYSTLVASLFLYAAMIVGAGLALKKKRHWRMTAALFFLIAIHPQFVFQHRYVWNPSLVTPFLLVGFWGWWQYQSKKDWRWLAVFTGGLSVAAGLNFSLVPTVAMMALLFLWEQRKNKRGIWQFALLGLLANFLVHAPTMAFEIRHNFLLTRNLPTQELLQQESGFFPKASALLEHLFLPEQAGETTVILGMGVVIGLLFLVQRSQKLQSSWVMTRALQIAGASAVLMLATPLRIHEHYVFGMLTFLLVALARLPKPIIWWVLAGASVLYLQPYYWNAYTKPAPHAVVEQRSCVQQVCDRLKENEWQPVFVNTHSSSHNHQAREYIFWLKEMGCQAVDTQEFFVTPTEYMAVVADRAEFQNGETAYFELSQFGPADELETITCKENLNIHLLQKASQ